MNRTILTGAVLLLGLLGSCSKSTPGYTPTPPGSGSNGGGGSTVSISGFAFSPDTLRVSVGTTVLWTNHDPTNHTVTDNAGAFDSGNVPPGSSFSHTFPAADTVRYHCNIHLYMKAVIIVK